MSVEILHQLSHTTPSGFEINFTVGRISKSRDREGPVEVADSRHPSADHVSPPARNRMKGSGSANTGGSHVDGNAERGGPSKAIPTGGVENPARKNTIDETTSLAAREGEKPLHFNPNPSRPAIPAETSKAGAGVAHPAPAGTFTTQDGTVLRVDGEAA